MPDLYSFIIRYTKGALTSELVTNPVYALVLNWPNSKIIDLAAPIAGNSTKISFLGYAGQIQVRFSGYSSVLLNICIHSILCLFSGSHLRTASELPFRRDPKCLMIGRGFFVSTT